MNKKFQIPKLVSAIIKRTLHYPIICVLVCTLLIFNLSYAQVNLKQNLSIKEENVEIKDILKLIEKQANVSFVYSPNTINSSQKLSISVTNKSLENILNEIFSNTNIKFTIRENKILLTNESSPTQLKKTGENKTISKPVRGIVKDENGKGLLGVSVIIKGTKTGTQTFRDGSFSITVSENNILEFSFVGYENQQMLVGNNSQFDISLVPSNKFLNDVVVIGYGERQRKDLTGAVSVVGSEDLMKTKSVTPEMAMQGRLPGVYVGSSSGAPNQRPTVRIRGVNTVGNNEPLYVVDGVALTEYGSGITQSDPSLAADIRGNVNVLSLINPDDIESISVLKDASSAAIYGVRAANGVILITTKKGKAGKAKLELSASRGVQNIVNKYDVLSVPDYVSLVKEMYANNPSIAATLPNIYKDTSALYLGNLATTDWQTVLRRNNAITEDYSLKLSGGSDATKYYISGGYTKTESPLIANLLKRYSFSTNVSSKLGKSLEIGLNNRFTYSSAMDNSISNLSLSSQMTPWQSIYNADGNFSPVVNPTMVLNTAFNPSLVNPGSSYTFSNTGGLYGTGTKSNFIALQNVQSNDYNIIKNLGTAYVKFEPIKGITFKGTLSADWFLNTRSIWQSVEKYKYTFPFVNPYTTAPPDTKGSFVSRNSQNANLIKEFSMNYVRNFGDHHIDVLLNSTYQNYKYVFSYASSNYVTIDNPDVRVFDGIKPYVTGQKIQETNALQGYLGRVSYNFKNKYYIDGTIRRDGTSRFASDYRWGTFPSFAAAWRLSSEKFMSKLKWLDDLKLRVGVGELGNQETKAFAFLSQVNNAPDYSLGSGNGSNGILYNGLRLPDMPVPDLSWERVQTKNIGLDGSFFGGKLSATLEYYNKLTSGILQTLILPPSAGLDNSFAPTANIASVKNTGFEFQFSYKGKISKSINYIISGNLTTNKNEVQSLYNNSAQVNGNLLNKVGYPIGSFFGYVMEGIYQNQAEVDTRMAAIKMTGNNALAKPGDIYFKDVNGDGILDANDRTNLGKTIPGYFYGFNMGLNYKNLDLTVFFQGIGDVQKYNTDRNTSEGMNSENINYFSSVLNRWTVNNPSTIMPRALQGDAVGNNRFSSRWVEDGSFVRLKNIQLGYTLPNKIFSRQSPFSRCRIYFSANNVFTLTKYTGLDPESDNIPLPRTLIVGANISF